MPLDGIFLHHLTQELNMCVGARADKIHQPSRDELVLLMRSASFTGKLLISLRSGSGRIAVTTASFDNPADPPGFCKLLRKHLSAAKVVEISQADFERIVIIRFMSYNEMGDVIYPYLAVELITGRENLVLCGEDGRILDALRRSDIESSARLLLPGAKYTLPEAQNKLNPETSSPEELSRAVLSSVKPLAAAFTDTIAGVSPLISRELASKVGDDIDIPVSDADSERLLSVLQEFKDGFSSAAPFMLKDENGAPKDFSFMPVTQYGESFSFQKFDSFSSLLEGFYHTLLYR